MPGLQNQAARGGPQPTVASASVADIEYRAGKRLHNPSGVKCDMITLCNQSETKRARISNLRRLQPAVTAPEERVLAGLPVDERNRLQQLLSGSFEYVRHPSFPRLRELPDLPPVAEPQNGAPVDLDLWAAKGPRSSGLLNAQQERQLFYRFNYCRYRVFLLLRRHAGKRLGKRATHALLRWDTVAEQARAAIVRANTSLVLAMIARSPACGVDPAELMSEGNFALLRCVDKFDCSRGSKFSTYACRAILASFSSARQKRARDRAHCRLVGDRAISFRISPALEREHPDIEEVDALRRVLAENTAGLSLVERRILNARFSLNAVESSGPERTCSLAEVGASLGVSKERVRQLQIRAIGKLRTVLERRLPAAS